MRKGKVKSIIITPPKIRMRNRRPLRRGLKNWGRYMNELLGYRAKVGVEVGGYNGEGSKILNKFTDRIIVVDPYIPYSGDIAGRKGNMGNAKKHMLLKLKNNLNISLLQMSSVDAFRILSKSDLDFVYLDGNHEYQYIVEDIRMWSQNSKVLGGHDYSSEFPDVQKAVDDMAKEFGKKVISFEDNSWIYV